MTLAELDARMADLARARRRIVRTLLSAGDPADGVALLEGALEALGTARRRRFQTDTGDEIEFDLSYEIGELERDLLLVTEGEDALWETIFADTGGLAVQAARIGGYIGANAPFACWITDRDGTVNNYCGRYRSSVQAAYNAVALMRFASACAGRAVLLSSAPLSNGGLIDVSVLPDGEFVFAGSKGRELRDERGRTRSLPVSAGQAKVLRELNSRLDEMVKDPEYAVFTRIGSGLQHKLGQTTIARQDMFASIEPARSKRFLDRVAGLVESADPDGVHLRIEDTGKDIEIMLTVEEGRETGRGLRDFDKGDGIAFLDGELELGLTGAPVLVCGDTASDVAMVRQTAARGAHVCTVFVTTDEGLKEQVRSLAPDAEFAENPDVLVAALRKAAAAYQEGSQPRPGPSAG